ncbi:MAG TPA: maleylacetate reductase [Jiangellaceae bacterium]|nr:maleylacetate reductase [Jiangellaceae bacterium]
MESATTTTRRFRLVVLPQHIVFGAGCLTDLPVELEQLSLRRVLLIASGSARHVADNVADHLGPQVAGRFDEVRQHVPEALVEKAWRLAADVEADGVVTIGGGSATGLGKAVALATALPLVAVPTTYAGSEATPVYGVTGERKRTGRDDRVLPRLVMYDAQLTVSMPANVTVTSGFNALAHCVEALYAPGANPVTSLSAEEGLRVLARALPQAVDEPDDLATREDAMYGAYLAGSALAVAGSALHHTLCHVLGGSYGLGHGEVHTVLLPYVTAYNADSAPEAMRVVARALGSEDAAGGLRDLAETLQAPTSLSELGMPEGGMDDAAQRAVAAIGNRNPRPVDVASVRRLLADAFAGLRPGAT